MNYWTRLSVDYASQKSYLDDLFKVYPTIPEGIRDINKKLWDKIEKNFKNKDNIQLLKNLLKFELFPIKDSYTAYLRRDKSSLERNPATVNRLCGRLYELGLKNIFERCSEPKETNRQIGPLFRRWLKSGAIGIKPVKSEKFMSNKENAILDAGDKEMQIFAKQKLNYNRNKGLDFIGRFNNKLVIAEAKFLTDFGGHQNAQFSDAVDIFRYRSIKAERIAILDGVLYIKGKNKMYQALTKKYRNKNIMSALVLREFLYQL
jgi:hypothetical protein